MRPYFHYILLSKESDTKSIWVLKIRHVIIDEDKMIIQKRNEYIYIYKDSFIHI